MTLQLEYDETTGEPLQVDVDVFIETGICTEEDLISDLIYRMQSDAPLSTESVQWLKKGLAAQ